MRPGALMGGSPYSTSLRDHPMSPGSIPAYSVWGSDSSQLYRSGSGDSKGQKDTKQACSTLLITTATLIVMAVLAIAAVAAYLGGKALLSNGIEYLINHFLNIRKHNLFYYFVLFNNSLTLMFVTNWFSSAVCDTVMTNHSDADKCKY